ncbi:MAG: PrgI family protein [Bacilli bacterium]|nr:PrgI family protein [Bacilli bacterium]
MEVKINKEIRDYTESVYFGLSLRQFIFSILACGMAVVLYFVFRPYFGIETLSWLCILGAAPFAAIGFIKYNGMNAEEFVLAYIRSEFLTPKELTFKPENYYYELLKGRIGDDKKDENDKKSVQTRQRKIRNA